MLPRCNAPTLSKYKVVLLKRLFDIFPRRTFFLNGKRYLIEYLITFIHRNELALTQGVKNCRRCHKQIIA